ncbi:DUF2339 domain-containing protein [Oxalobacteraceae sp. CFBP 8763]|nr:DUF2339 domain-containing protein [Oxalobacteraceae sp. CFBP 8763]
MREITTWVLIIAAYPFIAAWLVGLRRGYQINKLEEQLVLLREKIQQLSPAPLETPAPRPADMAVSTVPTDDVEQVPPAVLPDSAHAQVQGEDAASASASAIADDAQTIHRSPQAKRGTPRRGRSRGSPIQHEEITPPLDPDASTKAVSPPPRWLVAAKTWLMTGNLVAKLGLVILFIGIAFLLKYVAATITIPIELRLAALVLADMGLLGWGWRLRSKHSGIGLPVQGTAIAILMLVIFSAFQRYALIPAGFAFALLVSLTVFTCLLAILQEAPWLAAFGIIGGFACPLLLSTGQGNHIALFSYYAMLNVGVFALAFKRSWHQLNLLGFVFTFGVAGAWGGLQYTPDHYTSAQAFLILFFLCYSAIPFAFAGRTRTRLQDYVDVTLIMGTPLLTFGFQVGLVRDMPFGLAFSALGLGGFYLVAGTILWRAGKERWRTLVRTFTVLGTIFGTLTIPFALDARWTSAAWALQGFGFVWFGLRHHRRAIWVCGLLLQVGAWISFMTALSHIDMAAALTANLWLGFLLLAAGAFAVALAFRQSDNSIDRQDLSSLAANTLANTALMFAVLWLLAGWLTEATLRFSGAILADWIVIGSMLTALLLYVLSLRMVWTTARQLVLATQIAGAIGLAIAARPGFSWLSMVEPNDEMPLLGLVILAVAAFATSRSLKLAASRQNGSYPSALLLLWSGIWWVCTLSVAAGRVVDYLPATLGSMDSRWLALYVLGIAATSIACVRYAARFIWPDLRWFALVCWTALGIITLRSLAQLYGMHALPDAALWIAWAVAWLGSEQAMLRWHTSGSFLNHTVLQLLHAVRTGGPWLAMWPTGAILIDGWLATPTDSALILQGGWVTDAAWSNYLPTWAMMLVLVGLLRRSMKGGWPTAPIADWYRSIAVPVGIMLTMLPIALWNLRHDGAMAPLPYLPLLNPLDLTTGFVLILWVSALRQLATRLALDQPILHTLRMTSVVTAWLWFNLMLLRSAAHYLGIDYRLADLAASQTVQALLSLAWGASAFVLMRISSRMVQRRIWWVGALLYGIVVGKLFLVDLASEGSMARVVSFVGVGLLLLLVGYLAPYPKASQEASIAAPA